MEQIRTFDSVMDAWIQEEAEAGFDRELSEEELEEVKEAVLGDFWMLIQDKIQAMIAYKELMERSKDAEKSLPHYKVIWKNENHYEKDFKVRYYFKTEEDAKEYIHADFITLEDCIRVVRVDENGETEVYQIH